MDLAKQLKIQVREVYFKRDRLFEADEVFLTSSIKEVFPVTQIDQKKIGNGTPGPVTQRLHEAYIEAYKR
jgi:branched-subunit amino acid aminotransferase/4-amino-4-deoxychorismate lyase